MKWIAIVNQMHAESKYSIGAAAISNIFEASDLEEATRIVKINLTHREEVPNELGEIQYVRFPSDIPVLRGLSYWMSYGSVNNIVIESVFLFDVSDKSVLPVLDWYREIDGQLAVDNQKRIEAVERAQLASLRTKYG